MQFKSLSYGMDRTIENVRTDAYVMVTGVNYYPT